MNLSTNPQRSNDGGAIADESHRERLSDSLSIIRALGELPSEKYTSNWLGMKESTFGVCVYCKRRVKMEEIDEWIDDRNGTTAMCPHCDTDAVVPESELPVKGMSDADIKVLLLRWRGYAFGCEESDEEYQ